MQPFSYTSLKIVYDQQLQEALDRSRSSAKHTTQKRDQLQTGGARLAHFSTSSAQKPQATLPFCEREVEKRAS